MWLENLKELKKAKGMTSKQIADATNLPEKTVVRIFSGDTANPYVDTLFRIVRVLDGSLDDILTDSKAVVGGKNLITLQATIDSLKTELEDRNTQITLLTGDNNILKERVNALTIENELLRTKLEHKDEIIALHKEIVAQHHYYTQHQNTERREPLV